MFCSIPSKYVITVFFDVHMFDIGTIPLRRRQNFTIFDPYPPTVGSFFTTIRQQIWQIFDPCPPKGCRHLKWMVPILLKGKDCVCCGENPMITIGFPRSL